MAAEVGEEIRVERYGLRRQGALGGVQQRGFRFGTRLLLLFHRCGGCQLRLLEQVAVDLARRKLRQRIENFVAARHHVGGQIGAQVGAHLLGVERRALVRRQEGDEFVDPVHAAQHDRGLRDAREICQLRLDLAEFDAKAPDLHLVVDAAAEIDVSRLVHHDSVAGTIEDRVGVAEAEGIGDEFLRRQLVALEIALGDARPADQQLALDAAVEQVQRVVADIGRVIGDRPADRHGPVGLDDGGGRDHGRFGRAIGIEDRAAGLAPAGRHGGRARLAAENDDAQLRRILRHHREQGRHRVEHGYAGVVQHVGQLVGLAHHLRRRDEQRRADQIGNPDFLHRQVEGDGSALEDDVAGGDAVQFVGRTQIVADVAPGDDDALGRPRRAGRIDHVGGMVGRRAERARVDRRIVGGIDDRLVDQDRAGHVPFRFQREFGRGQQALGLRVGKADRDTVDRRVGVERQPGGAGFGDGDLRDQQFRPARHPQADDVAGPHVARDQRARDAGRQRVDLRVIVDPLERLHRRVMRTVAHRVGEDFREQFVAQMFRRDAADQYGPGGLVRREAGRVRRGDGGGVRHGGLDLVHPARLSSLAPVSFAPVRPVEASRSRLQFRRPRASSIVAPDRRGLAQVRRPSYPAPRLNMQ